MSHRTTAAAPPLTWSRAFPARADQARDARRFVSGLLDGSPAADDVILCVSELVTNATVHSRSRQPGGIFTVRAEIHGGRLRVEVKDQGGPWTRPTPGDMQHGHGLHIISQLAHAWGITGDSDTGWTVWFEADCL
jgi:anti-sigma regulatory factor (Ser/Thr protein kinase)